MEHYEHLKEYILRKEKNSIDREIDKKLDNPLLNAHYNGLKIELAALKVVIDALIERQKVLDKNNYSIT